MRDRDVGFAPIVHLARCLESLIGATRARLCAAQASVAR